MEAKAPGYSPTTCTNEGSVPPEDLAARYYTHCRSVAFYFYGDGGKKYLKGRHGSQRFGIGDTLSREYAAYLINNSHIFLYNLRLGAGEMASQLRAFSALPEDQVWLPEIRGFSTAYNSSFRGSNASL